MGESNCEWKDLGRERFYWVKTFGVEERFNWTAASLGGPWRPEGKDLIWIKTFGIKDLIEGKHLGMEAFEGGKI